MALRQSDDELEEQLQTALGNAEADRVRYHLREALQIQISDMAAEEIDTKR